MIDKILEGMFELYSGDVKRIQHFTKVFAYATYIGRKEKLCGKDLLILQAAAVVHDIGIHACEEKYGSCTGKLQEKEGPGIAEKLLVKCGADADFVSRVCFLVAHHHTYSADSLDWQILLESDFLVNAYEDGLEAESIMTAFRKIFKTETGKKLLCDMYGLSQ